MSARRDEVLALLRDSGLALDDDDIADRLGINRHYVNAVCTKLAETGIIQRVAGPTGKLVNSALAGAGAAAHTGGGELLTGVGSWRPQVRRADWARRNVDELIANLGRCLAHFERSNAFLGPSLYFHKRALDRRGVHVDAASLIEDELFMEYVYAVLPAWGMHRMGRQAAKVGSSTTCERRSGGRCPGSRHFGVVASSR